MESEAPKKRAPKKTKKITFVRDCYCGGKTFPKGTVYEGDVKEWFDNHSSHTAAKKFLSK